MGRQISGGWCSVGRPNSGEIAECKSIVLSDGVHDLTRRVDDLDRSILAFLRQDSRIASAEIARRLGYVSARAVRRRIDRLVKSGTVRLAAEILPKAVGYDIFADIIVEVEPGAARKAAEALLNIERVRYVAIVTGESDLTLGVVATDLQDFQRLMLEEVQCIPGLRRTRPYLITEILKAESEWQLPAELP
jgi:Lrp/AsnC family transcriptional regulator for asnA, asnC and gidA